MASITYDAQSFLVDGRRVWLVSGSMHYARVPHTEWEERLRLAKQAGLNAIETPVVWSVHEPLQGQFNFEGQNDLRRFIELVGEMGMYCILRPGPYVGSGYDMGGLPAWLLNIEGMELRQGSPVFLERVSKFISALSKQVKDLQATAAGKGGPILMIQNEHRWVCANDEAGGKYLSELARFYRESGFTVPTINSNGLWQDREGEVDCWTGYDDLLANLRQLAAIRPGSPRFVSSFNIGHDDLVGEALDRSKTPEKSVRRLAEVLAAGGQFNIDPFVGGTNFGFLGGRMGDRAEGFYATSWDRGAPVSELGKKTELYHTTRRVTTFASHFGKVLAHLDPRRQPAMPMPSSIAPDASAAKATPNFSVAHAMGSQGSVVFVFGSESTKTKTQSMTLLLPDGMTLDVDMGRQSVAWCLFDVRLTGRATLDYTNLSAMGLVGNVFVCFGPAGGRGVVSINGSPLHVEVPKGKVPVVSEHEGMTVVVASEDQADQVYFTADTVYTNVSGVDEHGEPVFAHGQKQYTRIGADGASAVKKVAEARSGRKSAALRTSEWELATTDEYLDGTSPRYASITGPTHLAALGAPYGYGWYKATLKAAAGKRHHLMLPGAGDRVLMFVGGEEVGIYGYGVGATRDPYVSLRKGEQEMVLLAENMGRYADGNRLGNTSGIFEQIWSVVSFKMTKPTIEVGAPVDLIESFGVVFGVPMDFPTEPHRLTWTFTHRRKSPIIVHGEVCELGAVGVVLVNDKPVAFFDESGMETLVLSNEGEEGLLHRGKNTVQIALLEGTEAAAEELASSVKFFEGKECVSGGDDGEQGWGFARWEMPGEDAFGAVSKKTMSSIKQPCWWKATFEMDASDERDVVLTATGMTKGQIYVNGEHLCRYAVASVTGKHVPPQERYVLPRQWLKDGENEIVLFDEHGGNPSRAKLTLEDAVDLLT